MSFTTIIVLCRALEATDLEQNHEDVSEVELLAVLRRLADAHGQLVLVEPIAEHGTDDPMTYFWRFEPWLDAREQAGLTPEISAPAAVTASGVRERLRPSTGVGGSCLRPSGPPAGVRRGGSVPGAPVFRAGRRAG